MRSANAPLRHGRSTRRQGFLLWWKTETLIELKKHRRLLTVFFAIILVLLFASAGHAKTASEQILEAQLDIAQSMDESISQAIKEIFTRDVFIRSANLGVIFALGGFTPVVMAVVKAYHADIAIDRDNFIHRGMILMLVLFLLGTPVNRGRLLGETLLGVNNIGNWMSRSIVDGATKDVFPVQKLVDVGRAEAYASAGIERCAQTIEASERTQCMESVEDEAVGMLDRWDPTDLAITIATAGIGKTVGTAALRSASAVDGIIAIGNSQVEGAIKGILFATGQAFVIGTENVKLVMFVAAPMFLGISMVPWFGGFWITWLKAFLILEFGQAMYNLIVSLVAETMLGVSGVNSIVFPLIVASLSIVFAISMTTGGGISLYTQATATAAGVAGGIRQALPI